MEYVADEPRIEELETTAQPAGLTVSGGALVIMALVIVSLLLRLVMLGAVALSPQEAPDALAAWRSVAPEAPGTSGTVDSVLVFWAQRLAFGFMGGSELAARVGTALAGVGLGLSPLLFSGLIGRARALVMAVLLTLSPVLLVASRFSSPGVWTMLLVVLGLWALWQYELRGREPGYGVAAVIAIGGAGLLTGSGGLVVMLILVLAWALLIVLETWNAPDEADLPGDEYLVQVRGWLMAFPWLMGLVGSGFVFVAVSTGFLLYPGGLGMVGEALGGFVEGLTDPAHVFDPLFFPLLTSVFYDPWLWVAGVLSILLMVRRNDTDLVERFLMAWALAAAVMSLLYQGGTAADALWTVVPLAGLASYLLADAFVDDEEDLFWLEMEPDDENPFTNAKIVKWVSAFAAFALMIVMAIHFQMVGQGFVSVADGSIMGFIDRIGDAAFNRHLNSIIFLLISVLLLVTGYFMVASLWGIKLPARAMVIGIAAFVLVGNVGSGWRVSVTNAGNPAEPWHTIAVDPDAKTLRETLQDLSFRETKGFPSIPVAVLAEEEGLVAWLLRDFVSARFIDTVAEARREQVAILPVGTNDEPDLGGSYVGQRVRLTRTWSANSMVGLDFLAWWSEVRVRFGSIPHETVVVWVRQDVYDNQPFE